MHWPKPSHNSVPEYQVSGIPYVTSSTCITTPTVIRFPAVTRWIDIRNNETGAGSTMRFGFSSLGVTGSNYFVLGPAEQTSRLEIKCTEVWFLQHAAVNCNYSLLAGLTGVEPSQFTTLTGSNGFDGIG